jgi:two-component system sensor histidine kinase/response regulator
VIEDVMAHSQAAFVAKGITAVTEGETGVTALADQLMFRTVLNNLVDNALKFTDRNGMVKVSWQTRDDKVILSLQDGGAGISSELIDSVHGRKQIKSSRGTSGEKGTGLGLGIVRSFVALNNGTLEIDSETGKGSVFRTIWPASTNEV